MNVAGPRRRAATHTNAFCSAAGRSFIYFLVGASAVLVIAFSLVARTLSHHRAAPQTLNEIASATMHWRGDPRLAARSAVDAAAVRAHFGHDPEQHSNSASWSSNHPKPTPTPTLIAYGQRHQEIAARLQSIAHAATLAPAHAHAHRRHHVHHAHHATIIFAAESPISKHAGGSGLRGRAPLPLCSRIASPEHARASAAARAQALVNTSALDADRVVPGAATEAEALAALRADSASAAQRDQVLRSQRIIRELRQRQAAQRHVTMHRPASPLSFHVFRRQRVTAAAAAAAAASSADTPRGAAADFVFVPPRRTALAHGDAVYVAVTMPPHAERAHAVHAASASAEHHDADAELAASVPPARVIVELCGRNLDDVLLHTELRIWSREIVFNTRRANGEWTADFEKRTNVTDFMAQRLFAPGAQFVLRLAVVGAPSKFFRLDFMQSRAAASASASSASATFAAHSPIDLDKLQIVGTSQFTYAFRAPLASVAALERVHAVVVHASVPLTFDFTQAPPSPPPPSSPPRPGRPTTAAPTAWLAFRAVNGATSASKFAHEPPPPPSAPYTNHHLTPADHFAVAQAYTLFVGIISDASNALHRWAIRRTWMSAPAFASERAIARFFVVPSDDASVSPDAEHAALEAEQRAYGDLVLMPHDDHHHRHHERDEMAHTRASLAVLTMATRIRVAYVLQCDDAVLVKVDALLELLDALPLPGGVFMGAFNEQHKGGIPLVTSRAALLVSQNLAADIVERERRGALLVKVADVATSVAHWVETSVNRGDARTKALVPAEHCHEPRFHVGALGDCARDALIVRLNGRPPDRAVRAWTRLTGNRTRGGLDGDDDDEYGGGGGGDRAAECE